jgi:DNA segregation ATPase FtsK/SpoIIIE, S-DNA-T family
MRPVHAEYFHRRQINALKAKDFARAREDRIPCNFEIGAFQAVWRARGSFACRGIVNHQFDYIDIKPGCKLSENEAEAYILSNTEFKSRFNTDLSFKFRTIAIWLAVFLGLCGFLMCFSMFSVLFGMGVFPGIVGKFFARSFGILSLLIPVYLGYAAFTLADPKWRPDRVFILSAGIFPFITLAIGFAFLRDFEYRSAQSALLNFTGKTGFSLIIIFITVIEILVLQVLKTKFFRQKADAGKSTNLLPPPKDTAEPALNAKKDEEEKTLARLVKEGIDDYDGAYAHAVQQTLTADIDDADFDAANSDDPQEIPESEDEFGKIGDYDIAIDHVERKSEGQSNSQDDELPVDPENVPLIVSSNDPVSDPIDDIFELDSEIEPIEENALKESALAESSLDSSLDSGSVQRALEEAEAAAALYAEQVQKKNATNGTRKKKYKIPVDILNEYPDGEYWVIDQATRDAALALKETLEEFKIQAEVTGIRKGPVITLFEILPAPGVKLSKIVGLQDNIALRLAASSVRIVAPIPGKHAVGIEVPNAKRNIVSFREIIEGQLQDDQKMQIPVVMGKDISGEAQTIDLVQMPHLLIAGATGSGKSVCVNSMILSILYQRTPAECRLILIDPKIVELKLYNDIPHLLTPVITEPKKAFQALQYCIYEMERRYACLDSMGVRDIRSYNKRIKEKNIAQEHLPYIVVVIDEFADLMATTGKELESTVARLAAMSRAVGIHLVLATQRPSIDVITGLIKANIPSRIAFMVAGKMDSRIIIDMVGAEKLLGRGDMLYSGVVDPFPIRMQGAFVSEEEVEAVVEYVKSFGKPNYIDDEIFFEEEEEDANLSLFSDGDDPLYEKALEIVYQQGRASASYIQRRLKIGFNRAARLVDEMEHHGVVGPAQGSKPRELLRGA